MNATVGLLVPYGKDGDGLLWKAIEADKTQPYYCPACNSQLILKKGNIKAHHFAHKKEISCNQETILHKTAKQLIINCINDWKRGIDQPIRFRRRCIKCNHYFDIPVPDKVTHASEEIRVGIFVVDVCLFKNDIKLAGIEIKATHPVDDQKKSTINFPFIEVNALDVIENPLLLDPITDNFFSYKCKSCKDKEVKEYGAINLLAKKYNIEFSKDYIPKIITCNLCQEDILVFTWKNHSVYQETMPNYRPIPRTIRYRFSRTMNKYYWVNTCPYCNAIQGDYFLFIDHDGPFHEDYLFLDRNGPFYDY